MSAVAFSRDGAVLAAGDDNGMVMLWNAASRTRLHRFEGGGGTHTRTVALSRDGAVLAAGNDRGAIRLWRTR